MGHRAVGQLGPSPAQSVLGCHEQVGGGVLSPDPEWPLPPIWLRKLGVEWAPVVTAWPDLGRWGCLVHWLAPGVKEDQVCSGCRNKRPETGWLKQEKLIFSQFWRLEV